MKELTTNLEMFSYYRLLSEFGRPELVKDFNLEYLEVPIENVFEIKGFLFVADPELGIITELKSGAKLGTHRINISAKEPFSSIVGKIARWLLEYKSWEEINAEVNKVAFAYREPHLNLLII